MALDCPKCKHELAPGQKFCDNCGVRNTETLKVRTKEEIEVMKEKLLSLLSLAEEYPGVKGIAMAMVVFPQISLLEWVLGDNRDPLAPISNALGRSEGV